MCMYMCVEYPCLLTNRKIVQSHRINLIMNRKNSKIDIVRENWNHKIIKFGICGWNWYQSKVNIDMRKQNISFRFKSSFIYIYIIIIYCILLFLNMLTLDPIYHNAIELATWNFVKLFRTFIAYVSNLRKYLLFTFF